MMFDKSDQKNMYFKDFSWSWLNLFIVKPAKMTHLHALEPVPKQYQSDKILANEKLCYNTIELSPLWDIYGEENSFTFVL